MVTQGGNGPTDRGEWSSVRLFGNPLRMSKTALLELSNLTGPVPGREVKVVWEHRETPSSEKQVPSPAPSLAAARALVQFNGFGIPRSVHPLTPTGYRRGYLA